MLQKILAYWLKKKGDDAICNTEKMKTQHGSSGKGRVIDIRQQWESYE
jgi:hypothetical protein